jgi:nucleoside-diphosphate-sugar epimerase
MANWKFEMSLRTVFVTGSQGYIGTELTRSLTNHNFQVQGSDIGFYKNDVMRESLENDKTIFHDVRMSEKIDLRGVDTVIHLAAISNDPLGELNQEITFEVNHRATVNFARIAREFGVKRFIFISSQSIYGVSSQNLALSENSPKNPLTAYAKSKWLAEQEILGLNSRNFTTTAVRPSTVFGWGNRLRNDIIFNNMMSSGLLKEKIEVYSDGTPIRPVLHLIDLIEFLLLLVKCDETEIAGEVFNVGYYERNYNVAEVARIAASCLGGIPVIMNTKKLMDERSYEVSFEKAFKTFGYKAQRDLYFGGQEILSQFELLTDNEKHSYFNKTTRIDSLKTQIALGGLDKELRRRGN